MSRSKTTISFWKTDYLQDIVSQHQIDQRIAVYALVLDTNAVIVNSMITFWLFIGLAAVLIRRIVFYAGQKMIFGIHL
jgi:hypothetical protein